MSEQTEDTSLLDDLAEEFLGRCRAGERPSVDEYLARHPHLADELRPVLSAVLMMERAKPRREDAVVRVAPPGRIGEFRIVREIGRGGMGVVYEAEEEALGRRVALKVLAPHLVADERLRARFRREARAVARLHHTNIVPVFGVGERDGLCYYVMQMIQGRALDRIDQEAPTVPLRGPQEEPTPASEAETPSPERFRETARIGAQVADALAHAHSKGVLHRDIKPSNLILDEHGDVWVTDFGVAKVLEDATFTLSGDVVGTLSYMPPERFAGHSDARGDVYSLGVTLYEWLTGRPPFPDGDAKQLIHDITHSPMPPLRRLDPAIPADLETIVLKAAERDPAHRYQTAEALADDLRRFLADRPILARRASLTERAWRWCRRNPLLAGLHAAVILLLVAISVVSAVAYFQTAAANRDTGIALRAEQDQREQAEAIATESLGAMARVYDRFAPTRLVVTGQTTDEQGVALPPPSLPPQAVALLEDLLHSYERIALSAGQFPRLRAQAAEANHRIGDIRRRLGRTEEACAAYRVALDLYSRLPEEADAQAVAVERARVLNELGRALRDLQKVEEGEQTVRLAIRTLEESPEPNRTECRYELARAFYFLGQRDMLRSSPPNRRGPPRDRDGEQPTQRAISLLEALAAESPDAPEYRHLLACCYRDITGPPRKRLDPERGIALLRKLVKDFPGVPDYRLDLCESLGGNGPPDRMDSKTWQNMRDSVDLSEALMAEYPTVPEYKAAHGRYLDRYGMRLLRAGKTDEADKVFRRALDVQSKLVRQHPDAIAYGFYLSLIERSLGEIESNRGQLSSAKLYLKSATERAEALRKRAPHLGGIRPFLGMAYRDLANVLSRTGETGPAAEARKKAAEFGPPKGPPKRP